MCADVLSRNDPEVDHRFSYRLINQHDAFKFMLGLIRKYWFQYKKIEVILAYLKIIHHAAVGYALFFCLFV